MRALVHMGFCGLPVPAQQVCDYTDVIAGPRAYPLTLLVPGITARCFALLWPFSLPRTQPSFQPFTLSWSFFPLSFSQTCRELPDEPFRSHSAILEYAVTAAASLHLTVRRISIHPIGTRRCNLTSADCSQWRFLWHFNDLRHSY